MINQLNSSKSILILIDERTPDIDHSIDILAVLFENLGKRVQIIDPKNHGKNPRYINDKDENSFTIFLEQPNIKIKDVKWEESEDGRISINIFSDKGYIEHKQIKFKSGIEEFDTTLILNSEDIKKNIVSTKLFDLIERSKKIYFPIARSLSLDTFRFAQNNQRMLDKSDITKLLAGLYWHSDRFANAAAFLSDIQEMVKLGGDLKKAARLAEKNLTLIHTKVMNQIISNIKVTKNLQIYSTVQLKNLNNIDISKIYSRSWKILPDIARYNYSFLIVDKGDSREVFIDSLEKDNETDKLIEMIFGSNKDRIYSSNKSVEDLAYDLKLIEKKTDLINPFLEKRPMKIKASANERFENENHVEQLQKSKKIEDNQTFSEPVKIMQEEVKNKMQFTPEDLKKEKKLDLKSDEEKKDITKPEAKSVTSQLVEEIFSLKPNSTPPPQPVTALPPQLNQAEFTPLSYYDNGFDPLAPATSLPKPIDLGDEKKEITPPKPVPSGPLPPAEK